jgi:adenylate kinase
MTQPKRRLIAVLFGPPGSGKGTQAGFIGDAFDLAHVSTGDMLRAEVERGSALGAEVGPIMAGGELVPDELIVRVFEERMRHDDGRSGILIDGFPRTLPQAEAFDAMLRRAGRHIDILLSLDVPEEVLVERILQRAAEEGRADDTPEAVHIRMAEYDEKTSPVLAYYEASGANVQHVDGVGCVEEVQERVRSAFSSIANGAAA